MDTLHNTVPENAADTETAGQVTPETYDSLYSKKDYGTLDYPVNARYLDLRKSYLNWIRWHWHEEMEVLIVDQGIAIVSTDDDSYLIKPGQGLIINQNVMHWSSTRILFSAIKTIICRRSICFPCKTTSFLRFSFWTRAHPGMNAYCRH